MLMSHNATLLTIDVLSWRYLPMHRFNSLSVGTDTIYAVACRFAVYTYDENLSYSLPSTSNVC